LSVRRDSYPGHGRELHIVVRRGEVMDEKYRRRSGGGIRFGMKVRGGDEKNWNWKDAEIKTQGEKKISANRRVA